MKSAKKKAYVPCPDCGYFVETPPDEKEAFCPECAIIDPQIKALSKPDPKDERYREKKLNLKNNYGIAAALSLICLIILVVLGAEAIMGGGSGPGPGSGNGFFWVIGIFSVLSAIAILLSTEDRTEWSCCLTWVTLFVSPIIIMGLLFSLSSLVSLGWVALWGFLPLLTGGGIHLWVSARNAQSRKRLVERKREWERQHSDMATLQHEINDFRYKIERAKSRIARGSDREEIDLKILAGLYTRLIQHKAEERQFVYDTWNGSRRAMPGKGHKLPFNRYKEFVVIRDYGTQKLRAWEEEDGELESEFSRVRIDKLKKYTERLAESLEECNGALNTILLNEYDRQCDEYAEHIKLFVQSLEHASLLDRERLFQEQSNLQDRGSDLKREWKTLETEVFDSLEYIETTFPDHTTKRNGINATLNELLHLQQEEVWGRMLLRFRKLEFEAWTKGFLYTYKRPRESHKPEELTAMKEGGERLLKQWGMENENNHTKILMLSPDVTNELRQLTNNVVQVLNNLPSDEDIERWQESQKIAHDAYTYHLEEEPQVTNILPLPSYSERKRVTPDQHKSNSESIVESIRLLLYKL